MNNETAFTYSVDHLICHINHLLDNLSSGEDYPAEYQLLMGENCKNKFFFIPIRWMVQGKIDDRTAVSHVKGYPHPYSYGYATLELAKQAAEEWEQNENYW
jgi:hypothetical protein